MNPRRWRELNNLTLQDLSDQMGGIDPGYLSRIERGVKMPSGRVQRLYFRLSKKRVTPDDFKPRREPYVQKANT